MSDTKRRRLTLLLAYFLAFIAAGCMYAVFVNATGKGIPCIFNSLTGLKCPGCGMTRMCLSILKLDFRSAWQYNPAVFSVLPLLAVAFFDMAVRYVKTGTKKPDKPATALLTFSAAVLVVFGIVRNFIGI